MPNSELLCAQIEAHLRKLPSGNCDDSATLLRDALGVLRETCKAEAFGRLIGSVSELTYDAATFEVDREHLPLFNSPVIYAAFERNGICRYVGKSWSAHRPLSGGHHRLDFDKDWQILRIWRADVKDDAELCRLEKAAIIWFEPVLNWMNPTSVPRPPKTWQKKRRNILELAQAQREASECP
jgi:hypothetical protein